jgi:hypothetical protein
MWVRPQGRRRVRSMKTDADISPEERELWADYYEAVACVLEIMRTDGTGEGVLHQVLAQQTLADKALNRIKQIRARG